LPFVGALLFVNTFCFFTSGIRVLSNAGGVNPIGCAKAVMEAAKAQGIDLNIAVVTGDEMIDRVDEVTHYDVKEVDTGADFPSSVVSMNAYIG